MSAHDPLSDFVDNCCGDPHCTNDCERKPLIREDEAADRAAADVIERYRVALQNVQGVALNGPPDDGIGRCDAIDQIVHEALA